MDFLVLVHMLAGATWFGGHVYIEGLMATAVRTNDPNAIMTIGVRVAKTNGRVLMAAGFITLITGVLIVLNSNWEFEELFITIGLVLTVLSLAFAVFVLKPKEDRIEDLAEEHGLTAPETVAEMQRAALYGRGMTVVVTIVIVVMILKPGF